MPVKKKITTKELQKKMEGFSRDFFLVNVREYRNEFLSLSYEEIIESQDWQCFTGKVLNYIMDGNLKEAWNGINSIPEEKKQVPEVIKKSALQLFIRKLHGNSSVQLLIILKVLISLFIMLSSLQGDHSCLMD